VDFGAIEPGVDCVAGGSGVILHHARHFCRGQLAWFAGGHQRRLAGIIKAEGGGAFRDFRGAADRVDAARLDAGVRHAADVPDLREHARTDGVHRVGHQAPAGNLFRREDARIEQVALPFARNRRAFADDQARRGALGVVEGVHGGRHVVRRTRAGQRRHDDAVLQRDGLEVERFEQLGHGMPLQK
jgi:hypothetical protein